MSSWQEPCVVVGGEERREGGGEGGREVGREGRRWRGRREVGREGGRDLICIHKEPVQCKCHHKPTAGSMLQTLYDTDTMM